MNGDLLSTRRMFGGGAPGEGTPSDRREFSARFQSAPAASEAIRSAAKDVEAVVSVGDPRLFEIYTGGPASQLPPLWPIIPNIQGFMREAVEHGIAGAGWMRVRRMGLGSLMGLGFRGLGRGSALLRRDFPTMLLCFIELELAEFRRFNPRYVFLQPQIADLALAMENPRILSVFTDAVRRLTGASPAFMTHNFGTFAELASRWGIEPAAFIAPWESSGAGMRPFRESCIDAQKKFGCPLWADRSGRISSPEKNDSDFLRESAVRGLLRDDNAILGLAPICAPV